MTSFFTNPTPILESDFTYDEDMVYVFLCALLLLLCLFLFLLIHLCRFTFSTTKNTTTTPLLANHPDAPMLGFFSGGIAGESSRVDVEKCGGSGCVVCLSSMEEGGAGTRVLPRCGHTFHVGCIARWLVSRPSCPLCRAPTTDGGRTAPPEAMAAPGRMRMEAYERMDDLFVPLTLRSYFM